MWAGRGGGGVTLLHFQGTYRIGVSTSRSCFISYEQEHGQLQMFGPANGVSKVTI